MIREAVAGMSDPYKQKLYSEMLRSYATRGARLLDRGVALSGQASKHPAAGAAQALTQARALA